MCKDSLYKQDPNLPCFFLKDRFRIWLSRKLQSPKNGTKHFNGQEVNKCQCPHLSELQLEYNNVRWETTPMRDHLAWKTTFCKSLVLYFPCCTSERPPVLKDYFWACPWDRLKTGTIVLQYRSILQMNELRITYSDSCVCSIFDSLQETIILWVKCHCECTVNDVTWSKK